MRHVDDGTAQPRGHLRKVDAGHAAHFSLTSCMRLML
jgi:hypothetical protein